MGYRSEVYLKTTTEGWLIFKRFNDSIENPKERYLKSELGEVNRTKSGNYKIYYGDVKWYDSYIEVINFKKALKLLKDAEIPYSYIRLGEETGDIEYDKSYPDDPCDMPDEIEYFEPITSIDDPEVGCYEPVSLEEERSK